MDTFSVFGRQSGNVPKKKYSADRFVPKRAGVDHGSLKSKIYHERKHFLNCGDDIFVQHPQYWRLQGYRNLLNRSCNVNDSSPEPLLNVREGRKNKKRQTATTSSPSTWACWPRRRPVILQPYVILDLPGYEELMDFEILDWGKRDYLVAGLNDQLFMLESSTSYVTLLHTLNDSADSVLVVKWDPSGIYIAVGTQLGKLYIYDSNLGIVINIPTMWYGHDEPLFAITALAWSPKGFNLACCTDSGLLSICDTRDKKPPKVCRKAHEGGIIKCSFSPNGEFLVTSGTDGNVRIWRLPDLKPFFQIVYAHTAWTIAWHPWRGCQLAVGGGLGPQRGHGDGSLSVWDVSLCANLCHQLPSIPCAVDALAWSNLTGELVVSYWIKGRHHIVGGYPGSEEQVDGHARVLVLSAPGKATDELSCFTGRTKLLIFNADGTKLASASSDENLFIWNFLGCNGPLLQMHERNIKRAKEMFRVSEINEYNNFGFTIR